MNKITLVFVLVLFLVGCSSDNGSLTEEGIWGRAGLKDGNSAVYMTIKNASKTDDALISANCPAAKMSELHLSTMGADGMMQMIHQDEIPIPAEGSTVLKPGGLHIMLMGLNQDLVEGQTIECNLTFKHAEEATISVPIRTP